jgi:opacity protein-like surface antigen
MNKTNTSIARFFKKTALALAVSTALLGAKTVSAQYDAEINAFFQDYSFCDAQVLAVAWGVDTYEAKVRGGQKVLAGGSGVVWNDFLVPTLDWYGQSDQLPPENIGGCYWDQNAANYQLGYEDAAVLACSWNANNQQQISEYQAKIMLGFMTGYRDKNTLDQMLNAAAQQTPQCAVG